MKTLIHNKKVNFNYEILDRYEAGIELVGTEVKSLHEGRGSLEGSFIITSAGQVFVMAMNIPAYQPTNAPGYNPIRPRKLLLTKAEIHRLENLEKGLTIVPILVYNKNRKIKMEIATVRGKKKFDKREAIKKRDTDRDIRRKYSAR